MLQPRGTYIYYCAMSGSFCVNIAGTRNGYCDYPTGMVEVFVFSTTLRIVYLLFYIALGFFLCLSFRAS